MNNIRVTTLPEVDQVFNNYPDVVHRQMDALRKLIIETAQETEGITELEESLKWGEPSFSTPKGSTIRIDWKKKQPDFYAIYFSCTSKLVPTFRMLYQNTFSFEGSRAIRFNVEDTVPINELKTCISAALQYHNIKHLPNLGI